MKNMWIAPAIEALDINKTLRDISGDLEPDGLKVSATDPTDAGWYCICS